jgi:hypothetical protein
MIREANHEPVEQHPEGKRQYDNRPIIETMMTLSKDRRYFIHKTIITDIKPINYIEKVLQGREE